MSKPREWWIGITESGFDKWLTRKSPEEIECRNVFISIDTAEKCTEYVPVIEKSAYDNLLDERNHFWKICIERAEANTELNEQLTDSVQRESHLKEDWLEAMNKIKELHNDNSLARNEQLRLINENVDLKKALAGVEALLKSLT